MRELTETQKTILIEAICRPSGTIYPMPQHIKGGAAKKVLDSLAAKGLIDKDGIITQPGLDQIDPDWTSIYATEMCAMAKKEADLAIIEAAKALNAEADETTALANDDATVLANDETTALANDDTTISDEGQSGWTDEPDPEILALAKKHFGTFTKAEWPAIRNTIEEAYSWGFNDAKAKPKRQTSTAANTGTPRKDSKQSLVVEMLKRPEGATSAQIAEATGWQQHTIRGFLSIAKKKLRLVITAQRTRVAGPNQQGSPGSYSTYFCQ